MSENTNIYPKGSLNNPYTIDEYQKACSEDNWNGGYVEIYGYMAPLVTITASSLSDEETSSSSSFDSMSSYDSTTTGMDFRGKGGGGGGASGKNTSE